MKVDIVKSFEYTVAPARERGLKSWRELIYSKAIIVAPARERGLKSEGSRTARAVKICRSREGAWIEIKT